MASSLDRIATLLNNQSKRPPLHLWQPELSGDIDIIIKADGSWWHEGSPINRLSLVKLFASILRREADDCHYLLTPVEKWRVAVDDKPLLITGMEVADEGTDSKILFSTNIDTHFLLSEKYPLKFDDINGESRPFVVLDNGLEARVGRNVYYRLMELVLEGDEGYYLESDGARFLIS